MSPIRLEDKLVFDLFFSTCPNRLSDYTFANSFIWRDSIHLRWKVLNDCLCVFANGDGGLTMLFPPIGAGDAAAAVRQSLDICRAYNAIVGVDAPTRVEYVSSDLLAKFPSDMIGEPMSGDYVYETAAMIELGGSELASKRQMKNRFARRYDARTEDLEARHVPHCLALLETWNQQSGENCPSRASSVVVKRCKEVAAAADALTYARQIGLYGMVLYAGDRLIGFTLGEYLRSDTVSILIEKTDREFTGSAQYIFSEFCRKYWSNTKWCNVGDDWEIPSLAWTKQSYRPSYRLAKWILHPAEAASGVLRLPPVADVAVAAPPPEQASSPAVAMGAAQ